MLDSMAYIPLKSFLSDRKTSNINLGDAYVQSLIFKDIAIFLRNFWEENIGKKNQQMYSVKSVFSGYAKIKLMKSFFGMKINLL